MLKLSLKIIIGVLLIIIGLIGILIPVMPGWTPLAAGIAVFSPKHAKKLMNWIKKTSKKLRRK